MTQPSPQFPRLIHDNVYHCGYNSPKSYGAASYFIQSPAGNWMTDAPRFIPHLTEWIEKMGAH